MYTRISKPDVMILYLLNLDRQKKYRDRHD